MNSLVENGIIKEVPCGTNFSYVLNNNDDFHSTAYKVLQSQVDSCFVKCMKMLYNGKIQLYYLTNTYKSLASMLPSLDAGAFLSIITNVLIDVIDVKHNGFLSCQNIDIAFDHIYVEPMTYKVKLMYLPLNRGIYSDYNMFENELRSNLVKLISSLASLSTPKTMQLSIDLVNGTLSLEDVYNRIKGGKSNYSSENISDKKENSVVQLISMNAPEKVVVTITKEEFIIGKNSKVVDGVLSFNKLISRVHCKINVRGKQLTITDLESANGTYINGKKIAPNEAQFIKNGDVIRLANSDFKLKIT